MTLEGLTYGQNNSEEQLSSFAVIQVRQGFDNLMNLSTLLKAYDSNEWLVNSELQAKEILNGRNSG